MMDKRKPSILLLYCGGTIGMRQDAETSALHPSITSDQVLDYSAALRKEYEIDSITISNIDSSNMQPSHWERLIKEIASKYHDYDGFVVVQGTDTMAYTASALSFAFGDLGKPVVLTGTQVPPNILGSDAQNNLIHAFQVATMDLAEVVIVFGSKILRGNRTTKISESDRDAYMSPVFPELGSIRLKPELSYSKVYRRHNSQIDLKNGFSGNVAVVQCAPGLSPEILNNIIKSGADGIILETFGPGNVPTKGNSLIPCIQKAKKSGIPFVISTQCIYGSTRLYLYEVGQEAAKYGAIPASDMTSEAAYTKLLWALDQTGDPDDIAQIFAKNYAGEVTVG